MTLQLIRGGRRPDEADGGPRVLARGAPPSPGPLPNDLAQHLQHGEALIWWDEKDSVQWSAIGLVLAAAAVLLGFVSLFAPEFWVQPLSGLLPPVAAVLAPAVFLWIRERASRASLIVTDTALLRVSMSGEPTRLTLRGIDRVRRDYVLGGVRVEAARSRVHVPSALAESAGRAVMSQQALIGTRSVDDPTGWLG